MSLLIRVLLLVGIGWLLYRSYIRWQLQNQQRQAPPQDRFEPMVRCTGCGTYLPASTLSPNQRCGACEQRKP
jgi:hypothetical protein